MAKPDKAEIRAWGQRVERSDRRRRIVTAVWIAATALPTAFALNYCMALLGEPRALWLMQLVGLL